MVLVSRHSTTSASALTHAHHPTNPASHNTATSMADNVRIACGPWRSQYSSIIQRILLGVSIGKHSAAHTQPVSHQCEPHSDSHTL